jgi:hypothetical protein
MRPFFMLKLYIYVLKQWQILSTFLCSLINFYKVISRKNAHHFFILQITSQLISLLLQGGKTLL